MWDRPTLLNWFANLLFAVNVVAVLYALLYVLVHLPIFPLREVKVEGQLSHVNQEQIRLIVNRHLQGNFFTLDLAKARDAFEKLPWARAVSVRRRWPDQLEVSIEEHQALARWGAVALVNTHGELFHAASNDELPVFYGPGDGVIEIALQYGELNKTLKTADLTVSSLTLSPRRAWKITTRNGMEIEMGRVDAQARLERFVRAYRETLVRLNQHIQYADLRYPNGFAVRNLSGV